MKQIRLLGVHEGQSLAVGALQFHKGVTQHLSDTDAAAQLGVLQSINVNESKYDEDGHCTNFTRKFTAEIVGVTASAAPAPATSAVRGEDDDE